MQEGKFNDVLEMEKMPNLALITTSGYDSLVTDSANSAFAYATGNKAQLMLLVCMQIVQKTHLMTLK